MKEEDAVDSVSSSPSSSTLPDAGLNAWNAGWQLFLRGLVSPVELPTVKVAKMGKPVVGVRDKISHIGLKDD